MKFDLHIHTHYSDGNFNPKEVIDLAIEKGLDGIAITDHDSIQGIKEAMEYKQNFPNFYIIPGIEFSCTYHEEEVHILGYFMNYQSNELLAITDRLRKLRIQRSKDMVKKLNEIGVNIYYEDVESIGKGDFVGRVHIAKALIQGKYVSSVPEAFDTYLDKGRSAYVKRQSLTIEEAINFIQGESGLSIIAHPGLIKDKKAIEYCIDKGIDGLEAFHSKHSHEEALEFKDLAISKGLIATAGSDCHGRMVDGELLLGKYYINIDKIPKIKEKLKELS